MEATRFVSSSSKFLRQPFLPNVGGRRRRIAAMKVSRENGENYYNVDESMIVLRKRIKEIKILEKSGDDDDEMKGWMQWEKEYYENYNNDVCEAMGLLQNYLLNVRPCLALATLALVFFSVIICGCFVFSHLAMGIASALLH